MPDGGNLHAEPVIGPLLERMAKEGILWADAEMSLARSELRVLRRRYTAAAVFAAFAFLFIVVSVIIMTQTGVAAASLYLGNEVLGGLAVTIGLLILALLSIIGMRRMLHWKMHSIIRIFVPSMDDKPKRLWMT